MKIKKIGAILAGAVMIGSAVAAAWEPSENVDFFINPDTGQPNAVIVVGANAAASDVTAGAWIAAQIGNMAFKEVEEEIVGKWTWEGEGVGEFGAKFLIPTDDFHEQLDSLYWKDLDENEVYSEGDVHEWMLLWPGLFGADYNLQILHGNNPVMYCAHIHEGETFKFLGNYYYPIEISPDPDLSSWGMTQGTILCGDVEEYPERTISIGPYYFGDYKVVFKDISVYDPRRVLLTIVDPSGKEHSRIVEDEGSTTLFDDEDRPVFVLTVNDIFLGVTTTEAKIQVTTYANYGEIEFPKYCLSDGLEYWNLSLFDCGPEENGYNIHLWFSGFFGYYPEYSPLNRTISIPTFDLTKIENFDYVSGNYISVDFDATPHYNGELIWDLSKVTVTQKTGDFTKKLVPVVIDPTQLVVNDDEVTIAHKLSYNLILVGGPGLVLQPNGEKLPANTLTNEIVENNLSAVDWYTATGVYEYIEDVYSDKDVIIVAGADRVATKNAVIALLTDLNA